MCSHSSKVVDMGSVQDDDYFTKILSWTLHIHILVSKYRYSVCSRSTVVGSCGRLDMNVVMKSQSNRVAQSVCLFVVAFW